MYEFGAVWTIIGPDGTSIDFNTATSSYKLTEVTGFDSPNIRDNLAELPEMDGAVVGNFWMGARPVTMTGQIVNVDAATRNLAVIQLQQAVRGLRGEVTLYSQATGLPAMQATARLQNFRVTGGFVKEFNVALVCADPLIYSQATGSVSGVGQVATSGAVFPLVFDVSFGGGSGASVTVTATNQGNFAAPAVVIVTGPVDSPWLRNLTTGESLYIDNVSLTASQSLTIDTGARTAVRDDGTNLYDRVRFPASTWWRLTTGSNAIELRSSSTASAGGLIVSWRDAWA